ncbi:MarR family winged helix-turn-helix transcriptional regulator [Gordonia sp. HY442]|uniref:MarR family winged helix-turn-helix transcriptional regulator n=1 Tax=Gordonia zhenghanii TaxID=2911516 RepID=UPI001F454C96|nr:MarR family winged helix-turn-helix transcriptional regulator [Gordonia zhenghanii]MCF8603725.1 MarR family winged helix-turn-helix transcriptional regulator [Gordonia zhenghanii]
MSSASDFGSSVSFLLSQVGAHVAQDFAVRIAEFGLSPREFAVLTGIDKVGPRTHQSIASSLGMHRNNVTALVDGLIAAGLVQRADNPADRRSVLVSLTDEGRKHLTRASAVPRDLDALIREAIGSAPLAELGTHLRELADEFGLHDGVHPHLAATVPGTRTQHATTRPPRDQ